MIENSLIQLLADKNGLLFLIGIILWIIYDLCKLLYKNKERCPNCNKPIHIKTEYFSETKFERFFKSQQVITHFCDCGWKDVKETKLVQTAKPMTNNYISFKDSVENFISNHR